MSTQNSFYEQTKVSKQQKVVVLGESGVGKSNLVLRLTKDEFVDNSAYTIGADFASYNLLLDGSLIRFGIWDTAGK